MEPRIEPLQRPPLILTNGGHDGDESIEGVTLSQRLGVNAIASSAFLTTDGVLLLHSSHSVRTGVRRHRLTLSSDADVPEKVLRFTELEALLIGGGSVLVQVGDQLTAGATVAAVRDLEQGSGQAILPRVWLAHADRAALADWRTVWPEVRLVEWTRLERLDPGPEKAAADLGAAGIDAIAMHQTDWTGGLTTLFHRFGVHAVSFDCQLERIIREQLSAGVDAVIGGYADRLAASFERFTW